ncbi:MAG TPA: hypothetical protein DC001_04970 [Clostridiales bacterium]|mgnify:CR=1 FL=1|nr:hypothetical protein [Clostridiales bacterium]
MPCASFLRPADVMALMDCKTSAAYKVIRDLNAELRAKGAYVRPGRVSTKYFCERMKVDPKSINREERHLKEA